MTAPDGGPQTPDSRGVPTPDAHRRGTPWHHHGGVAAGRFLGVAFWVALGVLAAEAAGGLLSHSLALLSDAGHMLTDVLALGLSWSAARLAGRPPTPARTYGFDRAGILAALFNASLLLAVAGGIVAAAVARLQRPVPVHATIMTAVAAIALAANLGIGFGLGGGRRSESLNVRSAWLHVMGDAAASAGVLVAAVLIWFTGATWIDPVLSAAIALVVAWGAWRLVRVTINVLMEGTPPGIVPADVADAIAAEPGVLSVHHMHVWSLGNGRNALSAHLVLHDARLSDAQGVMRRVGAVLTQGFAIDHVTLQLETEDGNPCPPSCTPEE